MIFTTQAGLFFCVLPDRPLLAKCSDCAGGQMSTEHLTVALCVCASGEIE